jgi:hypothetical protein
MTDQEAHGQAFENGRKVGGAEGYARGKAEAFAEAGDLISVKAAREICQRIFSDPVLIYAVDTTLKNTPAVAARPVKRGQWVEDYETFVDGNGYESEPIHTGFVCSVCGRHSFAIEPYCHCGARMDGGEDG